MPFPSGAILLWSGTVANIPSGWVLCDGDNGTPNLLEKFVKGATAGQNPGSTGGAMSHSHADHAARTHSGTTISDHAAMSHSGMGVTNHDLTTVGFAGTLACIVAPTHKITQPDDHPATSHSITQPSGHSARTHDTGSNEPVFYELAYIMKT